MAGFDEYGDGMGEKPSLSEKTVEAEVGDWSKVKKVPGLEDGGNNLGSGLFRGSALSGVPVSTCPRLRCGGAGFRTERDMA